MKEFIINDDNLTEEDIEMKVIRVKALIINSKGNIILAFNNNTYQFPGGHVDNDESIDDHKLYSKTNQIAHELDKHHPTIGVRNFTNSELLEDIYGYNDFSCDSLNIGLLNPNKVKHLNKPLLVMS